MVYSLQLPKENRKQHWFDFPCANSQGVSFTVWDNATNNMFGIYMLRQNSNKRIKQLDRIATGLLEKPALSCLVTSVLSLQVPTISISIV